MAVLGRVPLLWVSVLGTFCSAVFVSAEMWKETEVSSEAWGYVEVRSNAFMFWWLYYADNPTKQFTNLPLVMWLQGGPGASGCGYGNFEEIGPFDAALKPRNTTWIQAASLLFVDNPVGSGFSYTNSTTAFAKDLATVSADMMVLLKEFFKYKPEFQKIPFYIFSESYGGKMAAAVSLEIYKAIQAEEINCKFAGVALGDAWISPVDSVLSWGPYLYSTSLLDEEGFAEVSDSAKQVSDAVSRGEYKEATELWSRLEDVIEKNTDGVNFYNILTKDSPLTNELNFESPILEKLYLRHVNPLQKGNLDELMNGPIREHLNIIPDAVIWGAQASEVFINMEGDFMKPAIDTVDQLLAAGINVTVYNGQLDLIVDTVGQENWVKKLKWPQLNQFLKQKWKALRLSPTSIETAAFYKVRENFAFYWILKAGHMVPSDEGEMALKMLRMVTDQEP
ncbi:retinoid-inducible serine carboxypeptidase [Microcaecilia unicolor]|uniref:Carboxypeptidase n=1 Tax=Microcaecilia unicolor TaxID=1415580 RepID=A0A6P7YMF6_9AMPH|nr:retinoid-inducible serine carboxypeptidase [Microcaecilia unicolor]